MKTLGAVFLCIALSAGPAFAAGDMSWNGTWVGKWKTGEVAQLVFAGNTFVSLYWNGEYTDANGTVSNDAKTVSIVWTGGDALATRDGEDTAHISIDDIGRRNVIVSLKREK